MDLRTDLGDALGAPYYKIEGLAAIPGRADADDQLLFGVREVGRNHEDFDYVCRVVSAPYRMHGDDLLFTGDFEVVYDFDPGGYPGIRFEVGLSSLEYDPETDDLYFLTSYEFEHEAGHDQTGAYMWRLSRADFLAGADPQPVYGETGAVFEFANKAEGVAVLGQARLFVVYDPDRQLSLEEEHPREAREPQEAPYTVLALE